MKGPLALAATMSLLVVTLALMGVWWRETPPEPARPPLGQPAVDDGHDDSDFQAYVARGRKLDEEPASWRGTVPDGALREDEQGNLIVSEEVRRRFDYFLSALGEEELNVLRGRVAAHLQAALSASAARQAWELFEHYIGYRSALRELDEHDGSVAGMRQSLEERRSLRDQWFSATTREAFFGFRDRYADFALQRRELLENERLDPAEKQARLEALEAGLPEDLREMVRASRRPAEVAEEVRRLREQGVSEARVYQYREQRLGAEAAERLDELDRRREAWRERYQAYRRQYRAIEDSGLAEEDRDDAIRRLRESLFDETEQRRVRALDRIGG
ncbi:MAG TPA: lipase secretion chaperone [Alcanivorax sp.]|nr:lipase secretion chaperone [Alcanivorax sp.]